MKQLKRFVPASVTLTCLLAGLLMPATALGLANPTPDQHWTAPHNNNSGQSVRAIAAASDGSYYIAGDFTDYSTSYGSAVLASASTGLAESPFPDVDDSVNVTISDGAGGWYIAGEFNRVGPLQRSYLAHINADGTADADFDADAVRTCGMCNPAIYALALDEDDNILYVGGSVPNYEFGGTAANGLIALDATDGSVDTGFIPPVIAGDNQTIYALALDEANDIIYAGGSFTTIGVGTTRNNLVSFDGITGATTSFDPNIDGDVGALAISDDGSALYAGGDFSDAGGTSVTNLARLIVAINGVADASFAATADSAVRSIVLDENALPEALLYVGGDFADLSGDARSRLGAVQLSDGLAAAFDPVMNDSVHRIALTGDGSTLYAVGDFTSVNGGGSDRNGIAALATSDSSALPFNQSLQEDPISIALSDDEESALIGTDDSNYTADDNVFDLPFGDSLILHIMSDGTVDPVFGFALLPFTPVVLAGGPVYALALSPDESTLYIGGSFSQVGGPIFFGTPRNNLAAVDAVNGSVLSFNPNVDGAVRALAISSDGATLYAGGDFTTVNGSMPRSRLAAFATVDSDARAFDPDISGGSQTVYALELTADDSVLYIGGSFTTFYGPTFRNNLAAATTAGVGAAMAFNPDVNDTVFALALSGDEGAVYAGGEFTTVNGGAEPRNYAAAFEPASGVTFAFEPDADGRVNALAFGPDGVLYMGGFFDQVNGEDHNYIVAVDENTGTPDAGFDANLEGASDAVYTLAHGVGGLLAGGKFQQAFQDPGDTELPYVVANSLAHYADSATPTPTPATPTPTPAPHHNGGGGGFIPTPTPTPAPVPPGTPSHGDPANLPRFGLHEGDVLGAPSAGDPDVYIVNEWGYKRLFLNPVIFSFYGHLGFGKVHDVLPPGRDAFPISGLFRNCEANDPKVYAVEVTGEDTGLLHHMAISGDAAVAQDPEFFHKVFCINNREFNWYPKSPTPYTSLSQVPRYSRP